MGQRLADIVQRTVQRGGSVLLPAFAVGRAQALLLVPHHLKAMAPQAKPSVVLAGFQVGGSCGAKLLAGEREVKSHGEMVPVRAEIEQLQGFSGHADRGELLAWLRQLKQPPQQTFVVHGEPDAADTLRASIQNDLGWRVRVPAYNECAEI